MKQVSLVRMCLKVTYREAQIGKHLCDMFPIPSGLKQEMLYYQCF